MPSFPRLRLARFALSRNLVLASLLVPAALLSVGCHAQVPASGTKLSPELARRVEVLVREKASAPPAYAITVGDRRKSELPGWDEIDVVFTADGKSSKPVAFLLSTDNKTLAQFNKFDMSKDPRLNVSASGRPARGGPENAPVDVVVFDDLECPFCAKMHQQIFPAITQRYGNQVRVVYRDFPLEQHPWAMHAAIDSNCVGAQSTPGYWNMVDYIHAHADDFGADPKKLAEAANTPVPPDTAPPKVDHTLGVATAQLDDLAREQAKAQKLDMITVNACLTTQDPSAIDRSKKEAEALGVDSTPAIFINGEKIDGAQPLEYVFREIDLALVAEGKTPPPPFVAAPAPASAAAPASPQAPGASAIKGGR